MSSTSASTAVSHIGKIRASNQDSGYLGRYLCLVADGMGGHAGGDIASHIATRRIAEADMPYPSIDAALKEMPAALIAANSLLAETVFDHPELTGMGTTVSALAKVGNYFVLAHIGDSRVYRYREGVLTQMTTDHTFVQRLVDSGRITPEEAAIHPRRAVLMRVLGDVDDSPEIDTAVYDIRAGDRWLLCSDGLSGYLPEEKIAGALGSTQPISAITDRLIQETLERGAPDNVTALLVDISPQTQEITPETVFVGAAASPLNFSHQDTPARKPRIPTMLLHPLKASPPEDAHFEPEREEYLDELIAEDRRRSIRRRVFWGVGVLLVTAALIWAGLLGYRWTQNHYYVGVSDGRVVIFQGVQQGIGPLNLSTVYQETTILLDELPEYQRLAVTNTINADNLVDAREIVERLSRGG